MANIWRHAVTTAEEEKRVQVTNVVRTKRWPREGKRVEENVIHDCNDTVWRTNIAEGEGEIKHDTLAARGLRENMV